MTGNRRDKVRITCLPCHDSFDVDRQSLNSLGGHVPCPRCMATVYVRSSGVERRIRVEGHNAAEVEQVTARVLADLTDAREATSARNPWVSGSFYLVALLSLLALLLAAARVVSILLFPVVVIGGLVAVAIVGALQLRNDAKLGQRRFLELMALSFGQLPFIGRKHDPTQSGSDKGGAA